MVIETQQAEPSLDELLMEASEEERGNIVGNNALGYIGDLAADYMAALQDVVRCEAALANARAALRTIKENTLPKAMLDVGMSSFTMVDGGVLTIKPIVSASLPKEELDPELRKKAMAWLVDNDHGGTIKRTVTVVMPKGDDSGVDAVRKAAVAAGAEKVAVKTDVHSQTLNALVRSLIKTGKSVPVELFNIYTGQSVDLS